MVCVKLTDNSKYQVKSDYMNLTDINLQARSLLVNNALQRHP